MLSGLLSCFGKLKGLQLAIIAVMILAIAAPTDAFGQRSRSGGSRPSSSQRSSPSKSSKPSSSGWGSKKETAKPTSKPASKPNKAEQALYEKARKQGTVYKSREEAVAAFKAKHGEQLKKEYPTTFDNEPPSRPSYIPPSYTPPGRSEPVPLVYRPETRSYSWFDAAVGSYIVYDILEDDKSPVVASQMQKAGYVYGAPATVAQTGGSGGPGFGTFLVVLFVIIFVVVLIVLVLAWMNRPKRAYDRASSYSPDYETIRFKPAPPPSSLATDRLGSMSNAQATAAQADSSWERPNVMLNPTQHTSSQGEGEDGRMMKTTDPEFWRDIRPNSIVRLTDLTALQESLREGRGAEGEEYTVEWVYQIDEMSKNAEWVYVKMNSVQDETVYLLAMIVDQQVSLYTYYPAGGFESCSRAEAVRNGQEWLFVEPEDTENFDPLSLEYTDQFNYTLSDDDGTETEVTYEKKPFGAMQGMGFRNPPEGRMLTTVVMYGTTTECHSPEVIVIEMGAPDNEEGGLIGVYLGETINPNEISVHHA